MAKRALPAQRATRPAQRALISVSDKAGIAAFVKGVAALGFEILSTGGTARALEEAKIPVTGVEDVTGFPEAFGGRVKTLHPKVLGGILMRRGDEGDEKEASEHGIEPIDLVVVNLYPFEEVANQTHGNKCHPEHSRGIIEHIDIGGVTLLRSAAKNHERVTVVCDPGDYDRVLQELKAKGETSMELRSELASKAFLRTTAYDACIARALSDEKNAGLALINALELRYGENPHQWGKYYDIYDPTNAALMREKHEASSEEQVAGSTCSTRHLLPATRSGWHQLQGKQLSYLNILDADGGWNLVCEFEEPTVAFMKHANPSGVASHADIAEAFQRSYDADRLSAFGVIIALNAECPATVVEKIMEQKIFTEVLIAPSFAKEVLEFLKEKPKIRVIECACHRSEDHVVYRSSLGGMLVQNEDTKVITADDLQCVTDAKPTDDQITDLLFAWKVVKHAKSNAVVFAKDRTTIGIGCGQTSRVDSITIAARRAGDKAKGAVMASDAFFPFPDSVEEAAKHGVAAIIQPGGSVKDQEVIAKANELGMAMVMTGVRAFRH